MNKKELHQKQKLLQLILSYSKKKQVSVSSYIIFEMDSVLIKINKNIRGKKNNKIRTNKLKKISSSRVKQSFFQSGKNRRIGQKKIDKLKFTQMSDEELNDLVKKLFIEMDPDDYPNPGTGIEYDVYR